MSTRTILVADEDIDTRVILRAVFERHGFDVVEADTTESAVAIASAGPVDLIILNHPMMDDESRTLVLRLRAVESLRYTPIINLTSRAVPIFLEEAAFQGVTVSLAKPVDIEGILQMVQDLTTRTLVQAV